MQTSWRTAHRTICGAVSAPAKKAEELSSTSTESDMRELRKQKAADLRAAGKDPYAYSFSRTHFAADLHKQFEELPAGQAAETDPVSVAGRVRARRVLGKLAFISIEDDSGSIQLYVDKKALDGQEENAFKNMKVVLDMGDIVGATGGIRRTDKGELSVTANSLQILTKSLRPLPEKWHGLSDLEKRYRQRYVDMIVTEGVRDTLRARSTVCSAMRRLLESRGFLEVETPVLEATAGGADARPFVTYHNALSRSFTLRIATELHLKRMVVGGFERVFEIGRIFRNEGVSTRHNPEFTSVELYQAYADYHDMMNLTEELIEACSMAVLGTGDITYQEDSLSLKAPFRRATMHELVQEATGVDLDSFYGDVEAARGAAREAIQKLDLPVGEINDAPTLGHLLNACFEAAVEATLIQPTFVMDYPIEISPLAKKHRSRPGLVERFELFIAGVLLWYLQPQL
ncbi:hypothetical protein WJX73_009472 [Symbiochloris irregularis]|uniref:Lysine--tRNA ligase n=1 Tax=Symbiochloris irregularis TaxID=706552 RepID=A0AAW1P070_9CHLO